MFRKKKTQRVEQARITTLLARDVHITGNIEFSEGVRLDGTITGSVTGKAGSQSLFVISEQGSVHGDVQACNVIVNGTVTGNVTALHFVELQAKARVTGDIRYQQLQMDCGATVEGKLTRAEALTSGTDGEASDTCAEPAGISHFHAAGAGDAQ